VPDPKPPRHLSAPSKAWWRQIVSDFELAPWQLRTLSAAGEAHDRMTEARELLAAEGIVLADRFGQSRAHPAVAIERDARTAYLRAVRELALEVDGPVSSPVSARPPRIRAVS
jgi:P27 family predicted phage terminase small subunit